MRLTGHLYWCDYVSHRANLCNCGFFDQAIDASLAECCEGHAKFGVCYNDPEDER